MSAPSDRAAAWFAALRILAILGIFLVALVVCSVALELAPAAIPVVVVAYGALLYVVTAPVRGGR